MTSTAPPDQLEAHNKEVYRRFIDSLNQQDFEGLLEVVDEAKYQEICVGFTPGWVNLPEATESLKQVQVGIPDLNAEIVDVVAENDKVYARLTVTGTNRGRFFGMPPTNRSYRVNMFDYAKLEGGKITERVQQSDTFSQMLQLFSKTLLWIGVGVGVVIVGLVVALVVALLR